MTCNINLDYKASGKEIDSKQNILLVHSINI